ncbi:MAG TPA: alpha/beta fold hydrolase [Xanthobacteraceae bacterium]|nr:alpha/beta fold hydrolase [Xanthobacteraceae bacterium]
MKISANGISFNYRIDGAEGRPWLIFSNSLATDLHMWDEQVQDLQGAFRILRYDQRGHGQTEAPAGRYTFDTLIDDVIALMDVLAIARAHWCGLSMGGATGMGLAQRHADRFDRFIICDTPGQSTPATAAQWEERIASVQKGGMDAQLEATITRWFPPETVKANPPHLDRLRRMILNTPANGFIGCAAALANHDFRPGMRHVTRPVLYICGEKDGHNAAIMRKMQEEFPAAKYVELPGAGHISNLDQPALFNRALRDFLGA